MNFYKHYLADYDGDTAHLSWDEDMAYTRLLRAYYRQEKPIACEQAYRLARASSRAQRAAVDTVLAEYFTRDGDVWRNKRADAEIAPYQAQVATNRRIANTRKGTRTVNEPSHDSSHEPSTNRTPPQNSERTRSKEAAAPRDPLWGDGIETLKAASISTEQARTFIGKCLKSWPADVVADALAEARGTADPRGYATKLLQGKPQKREHDYTAGAR